MADAKKYPLKFIPNGAHLSHANLGFVLNVATIQKGTSPVAGIPYLINVPPFSFERKALQNILACPKINKAEIVVNGKVSLHLWGKGAEFTLHSILSRDNWNVHNLRDRLVRWANGQRKRTVTMNLPKCDHVFKRKREALEREIRRLEKRLERFWLGESPRNPMLECGEHIPTEAENKEKWPDSPSLWPSWERDAWKENKANKLLRGKVGRLALESWTSWKELDKVLSLLGATRAERPKSRSRSAHASFERQYGDLDTLSKVKPVSLVKACGLWPYDRNDKFDSWWNSLEHYRQRRDEWVERSRERKAMLAQLADLKELRDMPDKLRDSDVGIPKDVELVKNLDENELD